MLVVVSGSREWRNEERIQKIFTTLPADTTIIHGGCRGLDLLAAKIAKQMGFKTIEVPAEWNIHGKAAGPIRNEKMLRMNPDLVIYFHDNLEESKGTKNLVNTARKMKLRMIQG